MDVLSPSGSWRMMMISSPASRVRPPEAEIAAEDRLPPEELERPRLLDRPDDGDAAAEVLQDVDGHLGLEDDLLAGEPGQLLLDLELGQVADLDLAQEGQGDAAFLGDADDELVDLLDAEDGDLEEVLRPDLVFGARSCAARGRRCRRGRGAMTAMTASAAAFVVFFMGGSFGRRLELIGDESPDEIPADVEARGVGRAPVEIVGQAETDGPGDPDDGPDGEVPLDVLAVVDDDDAAVDRRSPAARERTSSRPGRRRRSGGPGRDRATGRPGPGRPRNSRRSRCRRRRCRGRSRGSGRGARRGRRPPSG